MRRNRQKFLSIVGRVKDLKGRFAREIEASAKSATDPLLRRVPRVAAAVLEEGQWLCRVCDKKVASNKHELTGEEKKDLDRSAKFFERLVAENAETIAEHGFVASLDAEFIARLEAVAKIVLRLDAVEKARAAETVSLDTFDPEGAEEDEDEEVAV